MASWMDATEMVSTGEVACPLPDRHSELARIVTFPHTLTLPMETVGPRRYLLLWLENLVEGRKSLTERSDN